MVGEDNLESRVRILERDSERMDKCIFGNGKPGLEEKIMSQIRAISGEIYTAIGRVERHAENNIEEGDQLVLNELKEEKEAREKQHAENSSKTDILGKKVDRLTVILALMQGGLIAIKVLEDMGVLHFGTK